MQSPTDCTLHHAHLSGCFRDVHVAKCPVMVMEVLLLTLLLPHPYRIRTESCSGLVAISVPAGSTREAAHAAVPVPAAPVFTSAPAGMVPAASTARGMQRVGHRLEVLSRR